MFRATGTLDSSRSQRRTISRPKRWRATTPKSRITKRVKIAPTKGRLGGASRSGKRSLSTLGRSRLSSRWMIQAVAQMVIPMGAKVSSPATK
jgi:hypothetical protein